MLHNKASKGHPNDEQRGSALVFTAHKRPTGFKGAFFKIIFEQSIEIKERVGVKTFWSMRLENLINRPMR